MPEESFLSGARRSREIQEIPVDRIRINPYQPRRNFDENELDMLADSIRKFGILQPLLVRPRAEGYELIAGERRLRAARRLEMKRVPALVQRFTERQMALLAMVENLQREDLNPLEEARGYEQLIEEFRLTQMELAEELGKSQSTIANKLRLLKLPESIRERIARDELTERHGRALLRLPDAVEQKRMAGRIVENDWTVRRGEKAVETRLTQLETGIESEQKVVRIYKDLRIFLNSFRQVVDSMKEAGVGVHMSEEDLGDYIEITVRVSKEDPSV